MLLNVVRNPIFWRPLVFQKSLPSFSVRSAATNAVALSHEEQKQKLLTELKEDLPKPYDGPERDLINFPRRVRATYPGKVRFAIVPDEWFTFFYKKTGVTGPYVFYGGLITFLLSKELYVIEDEFSSAIALFSVIYIATKKFGPMARTWALGLYDKEIAGYSNAKAQNMETVQQNIEDEKLNQVQIGASDILIAAKKENVLMQLETEYRRRLSEVYQKVKKRMDYHLDLDNTRKKLEQRHMVEWIVSNVVKSITAQQEKEALQKCLADLKVLSARA